MRTPLLASLALALAACSEPAPPKAPAAPAAKVPAPVAPAPFVPPPSGTAPGLVPGAAPTPGEVAQGRIAESPEKDAARADQGLAEIELSGTFVGATGASLLVHVLAAPCDGLVGPDGGTTYGGGPQRAPDGQWGIEVFAPRGAPVHICGAALDASGNVVALGGWKQNPQTFSAAGENQRSGVELALVALPAPKPLARLEEFKPPAAPSRGPTGPPMTLPGLRPPHAGGRR